MSGSISLLVIGFLAGGIVASVVWAVIVLGKGKTLAAERLEKEQIMTSIGEALAEADAAETSYRGGALPVDNFRRALGDKVNAVMRQLRTNMHLLDAYFVKYAEQEAREYLRVIDNPERRRQEAALPEASMVGGAALGFVGHAPGDPADEVGVDTSSAPAAPERVQRIDTPADEAGEESFAPAPEPSAWESEIDDFEPTPAPERERQTDVALEAVGAEPSVDAEDDSFEFEPVPRDAEPSAAAEEDSFEPEPEPVLHDTSVVIAPAAPASAPVREEELVLGESADGAGAFDQYVAPPAPPPAPEEEDAFDFSTPAAAAQGDTIDEFEAAFAQFEVAAAPPPAADHEFTETSSIDRSTILHAMGAAAPAVTTPLFAPPPYTPPPYQAPPPYQMPPPMPMPMPPMQQAPLMPPEPPPQDAASGITGDDVADSIDSFFNLK